MTTPVTGPVSTLAAPSGVTATLLRLAVLFGAGAALGLGANALHPAGVPLGRPVHAQAELGQCSATGAGTPGLVLPEPIAPLAAAALRGPQSSLSLSPPKPGAAFGEARSTLVIGDLRPPAAYARGHIAGAVHLPCSGSLGELAFGRIPPGAQLLLYDQDGRSADLQTAATTAALRGVGKIYTLQGGFDAWTLANLPAEAGTCERCEAVP